MASFRSLRPAIQRIFYLPLPPRAAAVDVGGGRWAIHEPRAAVHRKLRCGGRRVRRSRRAHEASANLPDAGGALRPCFRRQGLFRRHGPALLSAVQPGRHHPFAADGGIFARGSWQQNKLISTS